jgi:AcrR family transcriptional regulator
VEAARARLLDAAARCIARDGLSATSIASVATEASVSRPTVYRYFDDRDELIRSTMRVAAERLRTLVRERMETRSSAADMLVEAMVVAVAEIPNDPVLRAIWSSASQDRSIVVTFTEPAAIEWVRECLSPVVAASGWSDVDVDESIELVLRLMVSILVTPAPHRDPAELRAFLHRRLVPGLGLRSA